MKRSIIAAAVLSSVFMSAGAFAADVDTGTLTITGRVTESPCTFVDGNNSVTINMPTVPVSEFSSIPMFGTYDQAVGGTSNALKITCSGDVTHAKLSLITNEKVVGNNQAIPSNNNTVGYYLYLDSTDTAIDISKPIDLESYKIADGEYSIPFKAKYLKLVSGNVTSGEVNSSLVMRVAED